MPPEISAKLHREGPAESAALFGGVHFGDLQALNMREQPPRRVFDLKLA
jgi:hypothetical protein